MSDPIFFINGEFVPAGQATLALNDLGFVRGYGVFDLLRTYGRTPFRLSEHLRRLARSAAQIDLPLPWSEAELTHIVRATLARNDAKDVTIRIVVTGGPSANLITPEDRPGLLVMLAPVKVYPDHFYTEGASLISVNFDRFMPTVKSLNYITAIMGQRRARRQGAVEALYCTPAGAVTECTTSNLFVFHGSHLITPEDGVLPGVTRGVVLELAEDLFEVVKRPIRYAELSRMDEAFITSTTKELMPIVRIDDIAIGPGRPGACTERLLEIFRAYARNAPVPV